MPFRFHRTDTGDCFSSDEAFNQLYPVSIATLAQRHWTPLAVARQAVQFLATGSKVSILDIGSGAGKFCLAAAHFAPDTLFYGVEQRKRLIHHAENVKTALGINNASFIHANFTQLDFSNYDHFYFYNSFYENLAGMEKIDDSIDHSNELFDYYNNCLKKLLDQKPGGTRLVTFHSTEDEIPQGYQLAYSRMDNLLRFWIKL